MSKEGHEVLGPDYGKWPPRDPKFLKFWADLDCKRCYGVGHLGITVADKPIVYVCECVRKNREKH